MIRGLVRTEGLVVDAVSTQLNLIPDDETVDFTLCVFELDGGRCRDSARDIRVVFVILDLVAEGGGAGSGCKPLRDAG